MTKAELKQWRSDLEKSQKDMAHFIGVSIRCIQAWEQGINAITPWMETLRHFVNMERIRCGKVRFFKRPSDRK